MKLAALAAAAVGAALAVAFSGVGRVEGAHGQASTTRTTGITVTGTGTVETVHRQGTWAKPERAGKLAI